MVQGNRLAPARAVAASTRRLALGLAISSAMHLMAALGMSPHAASSVAAERPLLVQIQRAVTLDANAEVTMTSASDPARAAASLPPSTAEQLRQQPARAPAAGAALIHFALPLDKYYTAREVTVRAAQINEVELVYPQPAYDRRIEGKLKLQILINEQGGIDRVSVLEATPPGVFEEATLEAARALQFSPASIYGRPVKSQKTIEVVFDPHSGADTP